MTATDANSESRVRMSFHRQHFMKTIGAVVETIEPGRVVLRLPFRPELTQQHGFLHAGALAALADSACGYAALTLMPEDAAVLTIEFKLNLLRPATGETIRAEASVIRPGRTITVCRADVVAATDGELRAVAAMQATMMVIRAGSLVD